MIEPLQSRNLYETSSGWITELPPKPEIVDKINEIIDYLNGDKR